MQLTNEIDPAENRDHPRHVSFRAIPRREALLTDVCRTFGFTFWGSAVDLLLQTLAARRDILDRLDLADAPRRVLNGGGDTLNSGSGNEAAKLSCGVLSPPAFDLAVEIGQRLGVHAGQATSILIHLAAPAAREAVFDFLDQGREIGGMVK